MDENEQIVEKNKLGSADFEAHKKTLTSRRRPERRARHRARQARPRIAVPTDDGDDFEAHKLKVDRPTVQRPSLQ